MKSFHACVAAVLMFTLAACNRASSEHSAAPVATPQALQQHSSEFERGVFKVAEGVYVAIGYGIANSILLVGTDGAIVVDTMETLEAARTVLAEFRKVTSLPIKALIYTHSHPDHIGGALAFAEGNEKIPVYAQEGVVPAMDKLSSELQPVITRRSLRMYGARLSPEQRINIGVGPAIELGEQSTVGILRPNKTFRDELEVTVAGIHLRLVHAPGETDDHIFVWLPERKILLPGDNLYKAFPNLYTIRGTGYRSPKQWAASLDRMRALPADILVPGHTRPLMGATLIADTLRDYRDAIRYVYDQSIRLTNQGLMPDEIAARMQLPPHLASSPYLQPFYGKPSWSAKTVFDGNLGWFDGDPAHLQPLAPLEEARRMVELAGGAAKLDRNIEAAAKAGDLQWVLQLTGYALRVDPENAAAKSARISALNALGEAETNAPARGYYLMSADELAGKFTLPDRAVKPTPEMLSTMPLSLFFDGMAVNLRAEDCLEREIKVAFEFSDSGERYTYIVRRGVSEVRPGKDEGADIVVRVSAQAFKEMLARLRNPALSLVRDFEVVRGGKLEFARFMQLFRPKTRD